MAKADLAESLLRPRQPKSAGLAPLFTVAFLNTTGKIVAHTPAYCLQFQEICLSHGLDLPGTVLLLGRLTALRSIVELACTPILAKWSDRVGRKRALCQCLAAYCLEYTGLAFANSIASFSAVYIAGGVLASHNAIEGSCVVDATRSGPTRAGAFGKLFICLGLAFVVAPVVGGELANYNLVAPFVGAAALSAVSLFIAAVLMPEYLPEERRRPDQSGGSLVSSLRAFVQLVSQNELLPWYITSSALSSLGISAFITIRTVWAHNTFGWGGREIGRVVGSYGVTVVFAQFLLLPFLLRLMHGREALLAQLCLLVHTARFTAYGLAGSGGHVYTAMVLASAGACSVPILQGLCARCVDEEDQSLLSGGASSLNTLSQALGALIGSHIFAASLRGHTFQSTHLLFSAAACGLGALCVVPVMCAHARLQREALSWLRHAEGMHGMDATLPSPTARGSMLLRAKWVLRRNRDITPRAGAP